jgi:hypothetical protein
VCAAFVPRETKVLTQPAALTFQVSILPLTWSAARPTAIKAERRDGKRLMANPGHNFLRHLVMQLQHVGVTVAACVGWPAHGH